MNFFPDVLRKNEFGESLNLFILYVAIFLKIKNMKGAIIIQIYDKNFDLLPHLKNGV